MSDANTVTAGQALQEVVPRKPYYKQNVEKVYEAVKNGTAPFLVSTTGLGENEKVNIQPPPAIRSANTGKAYQGVNQLVAQISLKEMGSNDKAVLTFEQARNAGTYIKKGAKSFVITSFDALAEEGRKSKVYHLFPASSVVDVQKLIGAQKIEERKQASDKTIECHDSTPDKYIGSYLAATSTGAKFETDAKTMNAFQNQFTKEMGQNIAEGKHTKLFEMGKSANEQCKAVLKELYKEVNQENQRDVKKEYKNERQKNPGMSMGM